MQEMINIISINSCQKFSNPVDLFKVASLEFFCISCYCILVIGLKLVKYSLH